jgi:hypothetical protein
VSLSAIPRALRLHVFERDGGRCRYCRLAQVGQGAVFHINHIVPRSRGGATVESNLALQCPYCSLHKSDKVDSVDPETGDRAPLFDPLRQPWNEHFAVDDAARCTGLTATGRATVEALHMNDPLPRIARSLQRRLGLQ